MDCMITGSNVKVIAKSIHSLSKIGEELYLEPLEEGLALRTVNLSRSAYACFLFAPLFFQKYVITASPFFRCKMAIKSVQAVFKSLSTLEKTVEKCRINLNSHRNRLTFQLHCRHGLMKTHNLSFQDSESLQAVFEKENCANHLQAQPRLLVETVVHFPASLEEVSVSVSGEAVRLRNHLEEEAVLAKTMLTELCLSKDEFDCFSIKQQTQITFCLKELRGLLSFAESSGLPVSVHFDQPGRPVVFSISDPVLEVNFVLATLSDEEMPPTSSHCSSHPPPPPQDEFFTDEMDSYMIAMEMSALDGDLAGQQPDNSSVGQQRDVSDMPVRDRESDTDVPSDTEAQRDSGGPPNKKFRSLFFGSVLPGSSQATNQTVRNQDVLASDSEDEVGPESP